MVYTKIIFPYRNQERNIMNLRKSFGKRLKEVRSKANITQSELAEKTGIDAKHISCIETGHSFPKADLIEKFSQELDIEIPDLFNLNYLKSKDDLINEINTLLSSASEDDTKRIYKIITAYFK